MGFYALFTELTPVSSVSVDYTCTTNSATVQWTAVLGAESYRAIAMGDNGTQLMCTSQGTNCRINGLDCGQSYIVHVTPVSESCTNLLNSTTATFQTGEKRLVTKLLCHCHQPFVCPTFLSFCETFLINRYISPPPITVLNWEILFKLNPL